MNSSRLLAQALATWFGCGLSPIAPGTAGSLGALLPVWLLHQRFGWGPLAWLLAAALLAAPAVWAAQRVAAAAGKKDPSRVVIDEVLGMWVTLAGAATLDFTRLAAAFLLFRLLDVWKPPPARQLERLPGGVGIVADDVAAGAYGALVLFICEWLNR
jgi:phosphatidylglycerophosphatase A